MADVLQSLATSPLAVGERLLKAAKYPLGHVTDMVNICEKFRNEALGQVGLVDSVISSGLASITIQQNSSSIDIPLVTLTSPSRLGQGRLKG